MRWEAWILVISILFGMLVSISSIGKPRKPLEAPVVAIAALLNVGFVILVLRLAEVL